MTNSIEFKEVVTSTPPFVFQEKGKLEQGCPTQCVLCLVVPFVWTLRMAMFFQGRHEEVFMRCNVRFQMCCARFSDFFVAVERTLKETNKCSTEVTRQSTPLSDSCVPKQMLEVVPFCREACDHVGRRRIFPPSWLEHCVFGRHGSEEVRALFALYETFQCSWGGPLLEASLACQRLRFGGAPPFDGQGTVSSKLARREPERFCRLERTVDDHKTAIREIEREMADEHRLD